MSKQIKPNEAAEQEASSAAVRPSVSLTLGYKGGCGKTLFARAAICRYIAAGVSPRIVQIDKTPALPALYGEGVVALSLPGMEAQRADPLATLMALEPFEGAVNATLADGRPLVTDVGSGQFTGAVVEMIGKGRVDSHVAKRANAFVFIPLVAEPGTMELAVDLAKLVEQALPSARIVPVMNHRDGRFHFFQGSAADGVMKKRVQPMLERHAPVELPAIPAGALAPFDAHNLTFVSLIEAEPIDLARRLGVSRLIAATLQGDVAQWLAEVWAALDAVLPIAKEA
jgi:hypothetical protein